MNRAMGGFLAATSAKWPCVPLCARKYFPSRACSLPLVVSVGVGEVGVGAKEKKGKKTKQNKTKQEVNMKSSRRMRLNLLS